MVSKSEDKLIDLLISKDYERGFKVGISIICRENHLTDEMIEFLESNPEATDKDILDFLGIDGPAEFVDDDDLDDEERNDAIY